MRRFVMGVAVILAACAGDESISTSDVPELLGRPDMEIGVLDGPSEYAFGRISGIAEGPDGRVFVSDAQQHVIRIFDEDGTFVRSIGREGGGPGEFGRPCCIAFGPAGRLWVRDGQNRRYQGIDLDAAAEGDPAVVRMNHFDGGLYAPITFQSDGSLVDVGHHIGPEGVLGLWRFAVTLDGTLQDQMLVEEPSPEELGTTVKEQTITGGMSRSYYPQPYGPSSLLAHGPDGRWATAVSAQYAVTLRHGMDSVEIQGASSEGPPLSAGERERAEERLASYVARGGGRPSDYPEVPDNKTPLADMFFDALGRLWVELSVPEGTERRADVYGDDGALLERRAWPASVRLSYPAWVGEDRALGVSTDSLGVQRVVRVRFRRP